MLKRSLFFTNPAHLSTKNNQLVVEAKSGGVRTVPIEDIGFVVFEHAQISISMPAMQKLNANNVAVVLCDEKHHLMVITCKVNYFGIR